MINVVSAIMAAWFALIGVTAISSLADGNLLACIPLAILGFVYLTLETAGVGR